MIRAISRSVAAIFVAFILAMIFIVGVEGLTSILYPFPPGVDSSDIEVCKAHVAQLPTSAFLVASVGWGLATFSSAWAATRLGSGRHGAHGIGIGFALLAAAIMNMMMLPYPTWFWIANLVVLPAGIYVGSNLGRARPPIAQNAHA
ncbi:MAG: hypothetical protein JWN86_219 [Planctomycetota bacterium]|nr:hypothetical protein [Planctomycetota bacterium]